MEKKEQEKYTDDVTFQRHWRVPQHHFVSAKSDILSYQHTKDTKKSVEEALNDIKLIPLRINNINIASFQQLIFCCNLLFF